MVDTLVNSTLANARLLARRRSIATNDGRRSGGISSSSAGGSGCGAAAGLSWAPACALSDPPEASLYLPCTFPVPSLYLPCTFPVRYPIRPRHGSRCSWKSGRLAKPRRPSASRPAFGARAVHLHVVTDAVTDVVTDVVTEDGGRDHLCGDWPDPRAATGPRRQSPRRVLSQKCPPFSADLAE